MSSAAQEILKNGRKKGILEEKRTKEKDESNAIKLINILFTSSVISLFTVICIVPFLERNTCTSSSFLETV